MSLPKKAFLAAACVVLLQSALISAAGPLFFIGTEPGSDDVLRSDVVPAGDTIASNLNQVLHVGPEDDLLYIYLTAKVTDDSYQYRVEPITTADVLDGTQPIFKTEVESSSGPLSSEVQMLPIHFDCVSPGTASTSYTVSVWNQENQALPARVYVEKVCGLGSSDQNGHGYPLWFALVYSIIVVMGVATVAFLISCAFNFQRGKHGWSIPICGPWLASKFGSHQNSPLLRTEPNFAKSSVNYRAFSPHDISSDPSNEI